MRAPVTVTVLCLAAAPARAEDVPVSTADQLRAAIEAAAPGDVILLAPGSYALGDTWCTASGTAEAPIVVRADPPLAARVELDGLEGFVVTGAHWRFEGLDVHGVCAADDDCEHAFHVSGDADGFVLRGNRIVDFNAQLKVNAGLVEGVMETPDRGLIEGNELFDTRPRETGNPTTKLNIDTGDDWIVRGNHIHDFEKGGGDGVSYGAFLKSGGRRGVFERNLVRCTTTGGGGTRIGLSLGGGGTAPQYCAPAFDADVPCDVEHADGVLRNNIVIGCSDVAIYLNKAQSTRVLYNTMIATAGVDFRYETSTGVAIGNLVSSAIREREGGSVIAESNLVDVTTEQFAAWYADPLGADLTPVGDLAALTGEGPAQEDVADDYCAQARPEGAYTLGAIEHATGTCDLVPPPGGGGGPDAGDGGGGGDDLGDPAGGCGCRGGGDVGGAAILLLVIAAMMRRDAFGIGSSAAGRRRGGGGGRRLHRRRRAHP